MCCLIVVFVLFFNEVVQVREHRIILRLELREIRVVRDMELGIQLREQYLYRVYLRIGEVLIRAEEVPQKREVLGQHGFLLERLRRRRIVLILAGAPALRLKHIDDVLPAHEVNEAAVKRGTQFTLLVLNIQRDNVFPSLTAVDHQELHKIGLALAGVA